MWKVKTFKTREKMQAWIDANEHRVQWTRLYVNNRPFVLEYKPLRIVG